MIPTGIRDLDDFLGGGISVGIILDVFGASGTGKTQLLLQLLAKTIQDDKTALYIDTTGNFRPERVLEMCDSNDPTILQRITVSRVRNTFEQIQSISSIDDRYALIAVDNITDLFSYEYPGDTHLLERNSLFMRYMYDLSHAILDTNSTVVISNMIRTINVNDIENMRNAISPFTHIKIHLSKLHKRYQCHVYWALGSHTFDYHIKECGLVDAQDI